MNFNAVEATNELQKCLRKWKLEFIEECGLHDTDKLDNEKLQILEDLFQNGANLLHLEREREFSCLSHVFWSQKLIQFFVDRGIDPNSRDKNGDTVLHLACKYLYCHSCLHDRNNEADEIDELFCEIRVVKLIKYLLDQLLVDANVTNLNGKTALFELIERGRDDFSYEEVSYCWVIADVLLKKAGRSFDNDELFAYLWNVEKGFIDVSDGDLLNINTSIGLYGMTPLMLAARLKNLELCKIFIEKGSDINARDLQGFTALHYAVNHTLDYRETRINAQDCTQYLIQMGADTNAKTASVGRNVYDLGICRAITEYKECFLYGATSTKQTEISEIYEALKSLRNADSSLLWYLSPSKKLSAVKTVARLSEGNTKYFWNLLSTMAKFSFPHSDAECFFEILNFLSEELKRPGDFASLEQTDFDILKNLVDYFDRLLKDLIEKNQLTKLGEGISHLHAIANLVIACFDKLINEIKSRDATDRSWAEIHYHLCHALTLIIQSRVVIPKKDFDDSERLLGTMIDLELRLMRWNKECSSLLHGVLQYNYSYKFEDDLLSVLLDYVGIKTRNREGYEPVQVINWENWSELNETSLKVLIKLADMGAHVDARNAAGGPTLKEVLEKENKPVLRYDNLQCMCARVLATSIVPYKNRVPKCIVDFIHSHTKDNIDFD